MKRVSLITKLFIVIFIATTVLSSCANNVQTIVKGVVESIDDNTIREIKQENKNVVNTLVEDSSFYMNGVSEFVVDSTDPNAVANETSSSHVVNEKFEIDIDSVTTGNKYDPNEVNVYGQFVSPSGKLYEMPGFWYVDCDRYLEELDESLEYTLKGYSINGAKAVGVIDEKDGTKLPVAKIDFNSTTDAAQQVGVALDKSQLNIRVGAAFTHVVSVWLRVDENFTGDALYLRLYSSTEANDTFFKIDASELSTEWKKFEFKYTDGVYSNAAVEDFKKNYSIFIQTSGLDENKGEKNYNAVSGTVYASNFAFENVITYTDGTSATNSSFTLVDFVADELANYRAGDINGREVIAISEEGNFKIRFRFTEVGEWTYRVVMEKNNQRMCTYTSSVVATENPDEDKNRGIIRVEPTLKRNFMFEDGTPFAPIGINVPYTVDPVRGTYDYESYFPKMSAAGMNFSRTWLTYVGNGVSNTEGGVLNYDSRQDKAYGFDHILDLAAEYGIYLQIPMEHTGWFREGHLWDSSPYNVINGGYLENSFDFFTDERAKEDYKKLIRYYVARYSYSRNIMNWELFNEIGHVTDYDGEVAKNWANEMGSYLHTIDPYSHLVSMSSATDYSDTCYTAEELDFTSFHSYIYGNKYALQTVNESLRMYEWLGKPSMIGEIGASGTSESANYAADPEYYILRQSPYTIFGGAGASPMYFWWQMCDKYDHYDNVTPAAELFKLLPNKWITMPQVIADKNQEEATNVLYSSVRAISVWGFKDDTSAYVYMMDNAYSYANTNPPKKSDTVITLLNMADGNYTVRVYDTQNGGICGSFDVTSSSGKVTVSVPEWSCDIALLIEKQ